MTTILEMTRSVTGMVHRKILGRVKAKEYFAKTSTMKKNTSLSPTLRSVIAVLLLLLRYCCLLPVGVFIRTRYRTRTR